MSEISNPKSTHTPNKLYNLFTALQYATVFAGALYGIIRFFMWVDTFGHGLGMISFVVTVLFVVVVGFIYDTLSDGVALHRGPR